MKQENKNKLQKNLCDFGLIGLGVMGQNLALNMRDHGFQIAVYNRTPSKMEDFVKNKAKGGKIVGCASLKALIDALKLPRMILMMIKDGQPVDQTIDSLIPLLDKGDILIDGGNSNFYDTIRRQKYVETKGMWYIGTGISGGEEGARHGPSIMPGGSVDAWPFIKPVFQAIAAKLEDGSTCCEWIGSGGAGHYVKMVHNGIEYAFMQLISEAYGMMKNMLGLSPLEMSRVFRDWNKGKLNSFLVEITSNILSFKDTDGMPLVEKILDKAGQKGTGQWACTSALDASIPLTVITEAVFARDLSSMKEERVQASKILSGPTMRFCGDKKEFLKKLENALYAAEIIAYSQGFMLMHAADLEFDWKLDYANIAKIWSNGCIIRSGLLKNIQSSFSVTPELTQILIDPFIASEVNSYQEDLRTVISQAILVGLTVPGFASAINFLDGYRNAVLPSNLIQAQRDYFGSHYYERIDASPHTTFHTDWAGNCDTTSSTNNGT
jgi:6-phosphogluconate dehydrogenase